jgi:MSHA pilin protein MshD
MTRRRSPTIRRGFTLVEAVVSLVIVSVMFTAAMTTAAAARVREQKAIDRQKGLFLAQSLMSEILDKPYQDPGALPILGLELGDILGLRSSYNDVDDYDGLTEAPPKDSSGAPMAGYQRWSRSVTVQWVTPGALNTTSLTETNLKRVTVTVKKNGLTVVELCALRSKARDSL